MIWRAVRSRVGLGALSALTVVLALVGCANGAPPRARGTVAPAVPTATLAPAIQPPLTLAAAWGNVPIQALSTDLGNHQEFVFENAVTPDGQWLVGASVPRDGQISPAGGESTTETRPSFAVLLNISTHQVVTMRQLQQLQSQVYAAAADAGWVVWTEGFGAFSPVRGWSMFAYNRQTSQVIPIAHANPADGPTSADPAPNPLVDQGRVFWTQAEDPKATGPSAPFSVFEQDLATGTVTTVTVHTLGYPLLAVAWPWMVSQDTSAPSGPSGISFSTTLKNLVTGQTLHVAQALGATAVNGTSLAYSDGGSVYLVDDFTQSRASPEQIAPYYAADNAPSSNPEYPAINARIVAWTSTVGTQVYDRVQHRLVNLPTVNSTGGYTVWVGGKTLIWADAEPKAQQDQDASAHLLPVGILNVIDTTMLPAH
jgi:hypothetical protein